MQKKTLESKIQFGNIIFSLPQQSTYILDLIGQRMNGKSVHKKCPVKGKSITSQIKKNVRGLVGLVHKLQGLQTKLEKGDK